MMSLTYNFVGIDSSNRLLEKVIIMPGDANMSILKAMAKRPDVQIINPACDFAAKMKSGGYEGWAEEDIAAIASVANILSDAWHGKPEENIFSLFTEIIRLYVDEKAKTEPPEWFQTD